MATVETGVFSSWVILLMMSFLSKIEPLLLEHVSVHGQHGPGNQKDYQQGK
jgi:hypothetical protein